jgi:hypothetical protein
MFLTVKLNLPAAASRYTNDPNAGGTALGDLSNSNVSKFIIGGFQQHLGALECSRGMDVELHRVNGRI